MRVVKRIQTNFMKLRLQSGFVNQHISTLCKEAHEKIKIVRTHLIMPLGSIHNDVTVEAVVESDQVPNPKPQFLDISSSEDDDVFHDDLDDSSNKMKHEDEDENDNSFELIYQTPYAKIGYNSSKRVRIDVLSSSTTPTLTPPPVWVSPTPVRTNRVVFFPEISGLGSLVTNVEESPERNEISIDMFSESFDNIVPETPFPQNSEAYIPDTPLCLLLPSFW